MAKTLSIIVLGVGLILLLGGVLWFVSVQGKIAEYQSTLGQLGRLLSSNLRSQFQILLVKRAISVFIAAVGVMLAIIGAIGLSKK